MSKIMIKEMFVCLFIYWFDSIQVKHFSVMSRMGVFLGWTSTKQMIKSLAQGPPRSAASEARTRKPSIWSQVLYH